MSNRRKSKFSQWLARSLVELWSTRHVALLAGLYGLTFLFLSLTNGWFQKELFQSNEGQASSVPPAWEAPSREHWFGKTEQGHDLFTKTQISMAIATLIAVVTATAGIALALLFSTLAAMGNQWDRFHLFERVTRNAVFLPAFLLVLIVAAGSGHLLMIMGALTLLIASTYPAVMGRWFEECDSGGDAIAGLGLGLSRFALIRKHSFPVVLKKSISLLLGLIAPLIMVLLVLGFLGFFDFPALNCGSLIASGREHFFEAPWLSVCPGILASIVIAVFSFLGWLVARVTKTPIVPRLF